jgi:hypothetical protein
LFSKAELALETAGWSERARADIEVLPLVETEGLTPLLMVLNQRADVTATVQQRSQQLSDQPG